MHELSMDLNAVLGHAVRAGASDVHLKVGQPPVFRTDGELTLAADFGRSATPSSKPSSTEVTAAVPRRRQLFDESGDLDLAYSEPRAPALSRERLPAARCISFAFRVIPDEIPSFDDLHLPPGVARLARSSAASSSSRARPDPGRRRRLPRCSIRSIAHAGSTSSPSKTRSRCCIRTRLHRQPARGRSRHGELRPGVASRSPPGPGRDPDR